MRKEDISAVPFNVPYLTGKESAYLQQAVAHKKLSGNGAFTQQCQQRLVEITGVSRALLTSSCTDALEMCALLLDIQPGDEVIMPSYTFVSTANAFVLRGAHIVFCDSRPDHPGMDEASLEELITSKTKAIVPVHYAGVACDMDAINAMAKKHGIWVVEDAAQAIDSYYKGKPLGSLGHLSAFSFHETKNIISGEGGMLGVNHTPFEQRAEILWEKGTNRSAFWRGEVDKYGWVDVGSSFLPSELTAAFLWAQLEAMERIQERRKHIWQQYYAGLEATLTAAGLQLPYIPSYATNNAHMFYFVCNNGAERSQLLQHLKDAGINAVFHYLSLHKSPFYADKHQGGELPQSDRYTNCLVRLPMYYDVTEAQVDTVIDQVKQFYVNL